MRIIYYRIINMYVLYLSSVDIRKFRISCQFFIWVSRNTYSGVVSRWFSVRRAITPMELA